MSDSAFRSRLDAEHRACLDLIPEGLTDLTEVERARGLTDQLMRAAAARAAPAEGVTEEDRVVPGAGDRPDLPIRLYRPDGTERPAPALLYIHGGGFVLGDIWHFDPQCRQMAKGAGLVVASIEYRRAPEHPYPAPVEDCYAALIWLNRQAATLGLDPARIGVGGTSAGGALAAGLALAARDRGGPPLAFQFLEAPMLDDRGATESSRSVEDSKVWSRSTNAAAWRAYLGRGHGDRDVEPYASPARVGDLSRLPPAYICVSASDILRDEAFDYARRLLAAGVPTQFHVYEMGFHGSPRVLPFAPVSERWRRDSSEALKRLAASMDQIGEGAGGI